MILEARGFADDAEEAYWTNVQARAADRRSYERLIALYQLRRDRLSESLVRRQLDEVFAAPEPARSARTVRLAEPRAPREPSNAPREPRQPSNAPVSLARQLTSPSPPAQPAAPGQPIRRLRGARHADEAASPAAPSAPERHAASPQRAIVPADPPAVQATEVMPAPSFPDPTNGRRRARLLPNPDPSYRRYRGQGGGLIALQPAIIFAFVIAAFGAAALIEFLLISWDRGSSSRLSSASSGQVPAHCVDASVRFPGTSDPRGAVASAYRQQGVDVEAVRPGSPRLTVDQVEQVIGGWIGASLLLDRAGQPAPKLNEWLDAETSRPSLANAVLAGRHLDTMLTPDEWTEIRSWPASNCEGAFVQDPKNAGLIRLMERVVAR